MYSQISKILEIFTVFPYLDNYTSITEYITYINFIVCIAICIIVALYMYIEINHNSRNLILRCLFIFIYPLSTFLYIPFTGMWLYIIGCTINAISCEKINDIKVHYVDNSLKCYDNKKIFLVVIGYLTLIINTILTLIFRMFIFSIRVHPNDPDSRLDYISYPLYHFLRMFLIYGLMLILDVFIK